MSHTDVLFKELHADDLPEVTEIESLCVNCFESGVTKLFLTKIPFFRDVVISSFECNHCKYCNNNVDSCAVIQDKGVKLTLKVINETDLNRRMVKSKSSTFNIPHLDASFPLSDISFTTIEGALRSIIENLESLQDERKIYQPEIAQQIDEFINKLNTLLEIKSEFSIEIVDPTGNSIIENYIAPRSDPQLIIEHYTRSDDENRILGLNSEEDNECSSRKTYIEEAQEEFNPKHEVMIFQLNCPECSSSMESRMKILDIPHFKEVIVMASNCENCGFKENEVKGGCGIAEKGRRITLEIETVEDLKRDFLKSDTAAIKIPELEVETESGSLGGRFTTIEGIIHQMADKLEESNPFLKGDSATETANEQILGKLVTSLRSIANGEKHGVKFIIEDPAGGSYIQDIYTPEKDPRLMIEDYERTFEENELLGLNDMVTENYIS